MFIKSSFDLKKVVRKIMKKYTFGTTNDLKIIFISHFYKGNVLFPITLKLNYYDGAPLKFADFNSHAINLNHELQNSGTNKLLNIPPPNNVNLLKNNEDIKKGAGS